MAKEKKAKKQKKTKSGSKLWTLGLSILCIALVIWLKTTFIYLLMGLLPSIMASLSDRTSHRSKFHTVLACNLSGILPSLYAILQQGNTGSDMMQQLTQPMNWLIIYGSAAFGYLLYWCSPHIASNIITVFHVSQVHRLQQMQNQLVEEWGQEVGRPGQLAVEDEE